MIEFQNNGETVTISKSDFIDLLESDLEIRLQARDRDSTWNYRIEELEEQIRKLKGE